MSPPTPQAQPCPLVARPPLVVMVALPAKVSEPLPMAPPLPLDSLPMRVAPATFRALWPVKRTVPVPPCRPISKEGSVSNFASPKSQ